MSDIRTFKQEVTEVLDTWTCFRCTAKFSTSDYRAGRCNVKHSYGYGSPRDLDRVDFDLCESCLSFMIDHLRLNAVIKADSANVGWAEAHPDEVWGVRRSEWQVKNAAAGSY